MKSLAVTVVGIMTLAVFPLLAQEGNATYKPGNTPYVGVGYGKSNFVCRDEVLRQNLNYAQVNEEGAVDPGGAQGVILAGTLTTSGDCAMTDSYQVYAGADFNIYPDNKPILLGVELGWIDFGHSRQQSASYPTSFAMLGSPNIITTLNSNPVSKFEHSASSIYYAARLGYRVLDNRMLLYLKGGLHDWEYQREISLQRVVRTVTDNQGTADISDDTVTTNAQTIAPVPGSGNASALGGQPQVFKDVGYFYGFGVQYDFPYGSGVLGLRAEWQRFNFDDEPVKFKVDLISIGLSYNFDI